MVNDPRVLFVGHGAERTGPPIFLLRVLRWVATTGAPRPTVVLARDGELVDDYREVADVVVTARGAEPVEPLAAALRRLGRPELADGAGDRWLRSRLRGLAGFDVVHVNGCSPVNARLLAALPRLGAPVVLHVHELDIGLRHNLSDDQRRSLFAAAGPVFAVSEAVATTLVEGHGLAPDRISLHPGFVDLPPAPSGPAATAPTSDAGPALRRSLGIAPRAFVLGTLGLPDWRKAPDLLLRAAWTVRRRRPDIDVHIVWVGGDPGSVDGWQAAHDADHLGLGDRFHHLPHRSDPAAVLEAFDVSVSSAREDAFPLAALEGAAAGLPTVTFAAGGVAELVGDDAGLVVPWPDTDAMAEVLIALHDDPPARTAMGAAGRARVAARFTTAVCAPALWRDLGAAAGGPTP